MSREAPNFQNGFGILGWVVGDAVARVHFLAQHQGDQLLLVNIGNVLGLDHLAAAKYGDPVGAFEDFVKSVTDVQHRDATLFESTDDLKESANFIRRQHGSWLIEYQHASLGIPTLQCCCDSNHGALHRRCHAQRKVNVEANVKGGEQLKCHATLLIPVNAIGRLLRITTMQRQVVQGVELQYKAEILVDEAKCLALVNSTRHLERFPADPRFAGFSTVVSREYFDQG